MSKRIHKWMELSPGVEWCQKCGSARSWHAGKFYWQRKSPQVAIDRETFDMARSLVDGVYEMVLAYKPEYPAQKVWRTQWLANARALGAGLDEP